MKLKSVIKPFKNIWQVIIVMTLLNFVFLHFFWPNSYDSIQSFVIANIWGTVIWVTQGVGNSAVFHFLDEKLPWRNGMLKRAIANIAGIGLYSTIAYLAVQSIMYFVFIPNVNWAEMWEQSIVSTKITLTISFSISFILTFIGFGKSMVDMEVEKEKIQTDMIRYKYESLRNQINPHFLFNSFNVLTELVYEDQKLAEKFIHQLSDLYRYVLDAKDLELIEITKELDFIDSYVFLLKTRFEDRVIFEKSIENSAGLLVPMSLQLLVENCIKHNSATSKNPLKIKLKQEGNHLIVENNIQLKANANSSHKIGLSNLKERYQFLSEQPLEVFQDEKIFRVSVPIITVN